MKKLYILFLMLFIAASSYSTDVITGIKANTIAPGSELIRMSGYSSIPDYIRFRIGGEIFPEQVINYLQQHFQMNASMAFTLLSTTPDRLGFTHYRYQQTFNGIPLKGTMYIVHVRDGKVSSMNGMIFPSIINGSSTAISEADARALALNYVNATLYRWQVPQDESLLKMMRKDPKATWYPYGVLTYAPESGKYAAKNYKLCYRFDVFARQPLSRQYIYVDAQSGKIILTENRIQDNNPVNATAVTAYSGNQVIVADSEATNRFYLRDSLRGDGIVTMNMHHFTFDYSNATDFEDADNFWNNVNAQKDQYATDAHYGLEKTYDFYKDVYNRNSLDDNGFELFGYVHYDNNLINASWDGTEMNFGDGSPGMGVTPLTTLDITGHEMTHGVTAYTCNLDYFSESGGLNESFSDLAGEMVEKLGKGTHDWLIGAEIGTIIRFFSNPSLDGASASSYGDAYWNANTDVHFWSGVQNHWFYILSEGDTGINDLGTPYSVAGIGMDEAHAIAYRNQSIYLVPSSNYADARFYAIQSAIDLFGGCSPQHISCTNAWYAVGVGPSFVPAVDAAFIASSTTLCSLDNTIYFTNLSINGQYYLWDFGDGITSTDVNPQHQYGAEGVYTVSLHTDGGSCGADSILQTDYITIALPPPPTVSDEITVCKNSPALLSGIATGTIEWYTTATGGSSFGSGSPFATSPLTTTTTFFAENDITTPIQSAGEPDNNFGTGSYFTNINSHYLVFNAYDDITIQSVTVYSNANESRTIQLLNSSGNVMHSTSLVIGTGMQVVTLNFTVPAGTGYRLALADGTNSDIYRNQSGANYPYTVTNLLSITGNDVSLPGYYYYFYNWQVQKAPCVSERVPLTVTVLPAPDASFTSVSSGHQYSFTNTSSGAFTSTTWIFGDGSTATDSNPVHEYSNDGTYTVQLIECDNICCDTFTQVISLITGVPELSFTDLITVSPNPFSDFLQISYSSSNSGSVTMEITDLLGRLLSSEDKGLLPGNSLIQMNTSKLAAGIYFVKVHANRSIRSFKVVKQR